MRLQEWQADAERVLDQVLDGRIDTGWLDREIQRLEVLRDQLPQGDQAGADEALDELQEYLDADEADELSAPAAGDQVAQAHAIRVESYSVSGPGRPAWLQQALNRLFALADECETPEDAKAVRDITALFGRELDQYR